MQKSYITKFDEMKGDYVIAEGQAPKRPFFAFANNFFKKRDEKILENGLKTLENEQKSENLPQDDQNLPSPATPNPAQQPNTISVSDSAMLVADLYNRFRILDQIYQNLQSINGEFSQIFGDFSSINTQLQGGLLNIYRSLSSTTQSPRQNLTVPVLPSSANEILAILADYLQQMRQINYQLLSMMQVEDINRQLLLTDVALSIQADAVTNLRLKNLA